MNFLRLIYHLFPMQLFLDHCRLVKNIMVGEMMRILDGPFGIVDVTIENVQCGTDNHAVERTVEAIRRCTPEDVQRLAEKYLRREDLVEVTVG